MKYHRHQLPTIRKCPSWNNFDGRMNDGMCNTTRHNLISTHVDKNIISVRHVDLIIILTLTGNNPKRQTMQLAEAQSKKILQRDHRRLARESTELSTPLIR
mmetsp:Transcript_23573/g.38412  ORF Transcript_23573/g.38412 Transcript_23573/m.38412 type:complete len:101 (+) Transcript_23573:2772-3074(+)